MSLEEPGFPVETADSKLREDMYVLTPHHFVTPEGKEAVKVISTFSRATGGAQ